ncbi:MAG: hypothetical protein ACI4WG_01705 [Erysipelotrichaceae bacterium]
MYCVKCGVQLDDKVKKCPLCQLDLSAFSIEEKPESNYSDLLPEHRLGNLTIASIATVLCLIAITTILVICLNVYGNFAWSGYVVFAIALFYIIFVLPLWFFNPNYVIFSPINHLAICLYLLYVCFKTNGNWFISFAMPICLTSCIIFTTFIALFKYIKRARYFIVGSLFIALSLFFVLIELFEHITFNTKMFVWSLYPGNCFLFIGLFFILAGMIPPLKKYLNRKFFI